MATITSVTGQLFLDGTANINGTGFGASQGSSIVLLFSVGGAPADDSVNIVLWSDTQIQIIIPGPQNPIGRFSTADINPNSFFVVIVNSQGVRSLSFAVTQPPPVAGAFQIGQYVIAQPGANSFSGG